jgi:RNA polymerase sigma factor (sigma-70 family)
VLICQVENQDEIRFPRSYMLKTAKNLAFDHLKRAETRLTISIDEDADLQADEFLSNPDDTFDRVAANREFSDFCEAVRQLPLQCRKAFVLKKVYGYTQKEIAQSLDISENTVEKHIATGIKRCVHYMATLRHGDAVNSTPANSTSAKEGAA